MRARSDTHMQGTHGEDVAGHRGPQRGGHTHALMPSPFSQCVTVSCRRRVWGLSLEVAGQEEGKRLWPAQPSDRTAQPSSQRGPSPFLKQPVLPSSRARHPHQW